MTNLTAVLACLNEAHYLRLSLPRLAFCDEILVFDLGSTDGSAGVARAHGARVIEHEWVPFRERIIQKMLKHAQHNWVLMSDPDLMWPERAEAGIRKLIETYADEGLAAIYVPTVLYYAQRPLRFGQKSGRRASWTAAVVHRERAAFSDLVHHKDVTIKDGYFPVCLRVEEGGGEVQHFWIASWSEAVGKARRYLPYEGLTRHTIGQVFSWRQMGRELAHSLIADLRRLAFLEWPAIQVMLFQLWYTWKANMALRDFERDRADT